MTSFDAIVLGLVQGFTEFMPVSSDGHLEIANKFLGLKGENLAFTVVVHGATILSTIVVFWQEIIKILRGGLEFKWNEETSFIARIAVSMIPVLIVGLFFKDYIDSLYAGNMILVGAMLLLTAAFLYLGHFRRHGEREIGFFDAFIIGIMQALAVLPGLSRSATTISTGLMLGNRRDKMVRFSFLMVIVPIIGANLKQIYDSGFVISGVSPLNMTIGFVVAFLAGLLACKWMIHLVRNSKLIYFAIYCTIAGALAIIFA